MQWMGGYTVLHHSIMPQWTDLTYIAANGNFWIWLISWLCYKDEIMYEIMFHVFAWWWIHFAETWLNCCHGLNWRSRCSILALERWSIDWDESKHAYYDSVVKRSSDIELICSTVTLSRSWLSRLSALSEQLSSWYSHLVGHWLKLPGFNPCGHMGQTIRGFNFKVCDSEGLQTRCLSRGMLVLVNLKVDK